MVKALIIILGLSLDGFVSMMQTGATVRNLTWKKRFAYAGIYSLIGVISALIGFGCASIAKDYLTEHYELTFAALIIFSLGVVLMTRSYKNVGYEEKLDKSFNIKKLARLALITNIDTFALAAGFSFMNLPLVLVVLAIGVLNYALVLIALTVGYNLGADHQRIIGMSGGALMIIFSVWILINYVLMRV